MLRQRALNEYEQALEERLRKFETTKTEENRQIQAELDRLAAQYKGRIQSNLNQVERDQDELRAWQRRKQQECARITEAASACVSPQSNPAAGPASLTVVLERAAGAGR
jgi:DNA anti-recombination protein RmuC